MQIGGHTLIIQLEEAKRTLQGMRGDIAELGNALKIEKISEVAEELSLNRGTIYQWQQKM